MSTLFYGKPRELMFRARQAIAALQKRLSHRNPNVQLYALELANTLAQNCGKPLLEELASRNWTGALDRLVQDRTTQAVVKKKALGFIKAWAKQFEDTGDSNLGLMPELYDQLRAKSELTPALDHQLMAGFAFDEAEPAPEPKVNNRQQQEEEELRRVLELSKQDKGGRSGYVPYQPSQPEAPSSSARVSNNDDPFAAPATNYPKSSYKPAAPPDPQPVLDINSATRVRAIFTFSSQEVGELNFQRGDVIKVLDREFKEWWRGACNGLIGVSCTLQVLLHTTHHADLSSHIRGADAGTDTERAAGGGAGRSASVRLARAGGQAPADTSKHRSISWGEARGST